jgi:hypothetical protein
VAGGAVVHDATSEVKMTLVSRLVLFLVSGGFTAFLHHKLDAPVAIVIAKLAA